MVINVAAMVHDEARTDRQFSFMKNGFSVNNNRYFSVQSIRESEVLVLTANDIDFLKRDFPISSTSLFQKMIQQTKDLLKDHLYALQHFKEDKYTIRRFRTLTKTERNKTTNDINMPL